jgi:hypothetical protein
MLFQAEMEAERARDEQARAALFATTAAGAPGARQLQQRLGGAAIFTQAAIPAQKTAPPMTATTGASNSAAVMSASPSSRLQQMRDRQRGLATAVAATSPATSASSALQPYATSARPAISAEHAALLKAGDRFRLRTVAATAMATKRPGFSASASSSATTVAAAPAGPVPISLWADTSLTQLQFRLVSSPHARPDGSIALANLAALRRLSKPAGDCWFSIVQKDGQCMSVEASSTQVRDRWIAALEAVMTSR